MTKKQKLKLRKNVCQDCDHPDLRPYWTVLHVGACDDSCDECGWLCTNCARKYPLSRQPYDTGKWYGRMEQLYEEAVGCGKRTQGEYRPKSAKVQSPYPETSPLHPKNRIAHLN